jgi:hypothetical protein
VEEESQQVHEQELNGKVLYDLSGGTPHGRFAIANGAVRTADIRSAAKENISVHQIQFLGKAWSEKLHIYDEKTQGYNRKRTI